MQKKCFFFLTSCVYKVIIQVFYWSSCLLLIPQAYTGSSSDVIEVW